MSGRTTLLLFVILVIVAAVAYYMSQQEPAAEPTATLPPTPERVQFLEGIEMGAVTRLDVEDLAGDDSGSASFIREAEGGWFQVVPTQTKTISSTMNTAVSGLLNLTSRRTLDSAENPLSAYGLEEPERRITLAVRSEEGQILRHVFLIGEKTPAESDYYIQKEGDPRIYIVPIFSVDNVFRLLTEPPVPTPTPEVTATITGTVTITPTGTITATGTITP